MTGVAVARDGPVLVVTLARPERGNALDAGLVAGLRAAVAGAADPEVRLLVLKGEGRALCTGFDLGGLEAQSDAELLARFVAIELLLQAIRHAPVPSLGFAHGRVFGAGADLFAACTWRVADPAARFAFPGARFGLVLGTARLAAIVGAARALELTARGGGLDGTAALGCGFATELAAPADWPEVQARIAGELAGVDRATAAMLAARVRTDTRDADLAALVRSAEVPGLGARIAAYAGRRGG